MDLRGPDSSDEIDLLPPELFPSVPPPSGGDPRLLGGRYELKKELGRGSRGVLHEAVSAWTGRRVTIHRFHRPATLDERARFLRIARTAARLVHPHLVDVLDLGTDEAGAPYAALELLDGETLEAYVARKGALSLEEALRLFEPLADALALAHDEGMVHGNLSPRVIRMVEVGDGVACKLTGFGLLRTHEEALRAVSDEGPDAVAYRAPEQWVDAGVEIDGRADVWALALCWFHALTGRRAFAAEEVRAGSSAALVAPRASEHALGLGPAVDAVLQRALTVDPGRRTPSMRSWLAELVALREEARPTIRPPSSRAPSAHTARLAEEDDDTLAMRRSPMPEPVHALRLGVVWTAPDVDLSAVATVMHEVLHRPVTVRRYRAYAELVDAVLEHDVELGWLPPVAYVRARRAENVRLVLSTVRGTSVPSYHAALLGRTGVVDRIEDARGKRAAWVDGWSAAGYLMPRMLLEAAGLSSDHDLGAQGFVGSHDAVIAALTAGAADLGATYCQLDDEGRAIGPFTQHPAICVLGVSEPIPGDTLCAGPALSSVEAEAISVLLLESASRIAPLIGARGLAPGESSRYDALERALLGGAAR